MFAAPGATAPPWNLLKITPRTGSPFCSTPKRHKLCLLIFPNELRPWRDRAKTSRKISAIEIVVIATLAAPGVRIPPGLLESAQSRLWLETIIIVAAIGQHVEKIRTRAKPFFTIVTGRAILPTNTLSPTGQKTSISLGNLFVDECCWYRGF